MFLFCDYLNKCCAYVSMFSFNDNEVERSTTNASRRQRYVPTFDSVVKTTIRYFLITRGSSCESSLVVADALPKNAGPYLMPMTNPWLFQSKE